MKLALKLVAVCLVAMILITALSSYFIAKREFRLVKETHQSSAERVAGLIRESIDLAYNSEGNQGIVKVIRTHAIDTGEMQYRWVWFDVSVSDSSHPSAPIQSLNRIMQGEMGSVVDERRGPDLLHTYYPMDVNDQSAGKARKGAVEVSGSLERAEREAWDTTKKGLIAMVAMIVFCFGFIAWAGIRFIGRPLDLLINQTRLIGEGVFDNPVQVNSNDELGELATALNTMSEKMSGQQQQIRHADRLKTVGRLAAGIAHELGTPLNVISGRAGLIRSGKLTSDELDESAAAIQSESNRIAGIVRQLMDFARLNAPRRTFADVRIVVDRTIELLGTLAEKNGVSIETSWAEQNPLTAFVDESQIQQVLTNIVFNAIQAMPEGGHIDLTLSNAEKKLSGRIEEPVVKIEICDNGPGMDEAMLDQIFEPFFTTKDVGQGTGLGLSIAFGIVQEHGGDLTVESHAGSGTTFCIWLPKSEHTDRSSDDKR